jgi:hypothetical protein
LLLAMYGSARADYETDCVDPDVTITAASMPADLTIAAGTVVIIESGTFTGPSTFQGGILCVAEDADFDPSSVNGVVRLYVRGEAVMPPHAAESGSLLDNEGSVTYLPSLNVNGAATVINREGGSILVQGTFALSAGTTVTNFGNITTTGGTVNLNGSTITNHATITVGGTLNQFGTVTNTGTLDVNGLYTVNGGSQLSNSCTLFADGLINNGAFTNTGVTQLGTFAFTNNGGASLTQAAGAITVGGDFSNDGSVTGTGEYLFSGTTRTQGSMTGTSAAEPITFFDTTPTGPIFDTQSGTVTNVVRAPVTPPEPGACNTTPPTTTTSTTTTSTTTTAPTTTSTSTTTTPTTTTAPTTTTSTSTTSPTTTTSPPTSTTAVTTLPATSTSLGPDVSADTTSAATVDPGIVGGGSLPPTGGRSSGLAILGGALCALAGFGLVMAVRLPRHG